MSPSEALGAMAIISVSEPVGVMSLGKSLVEVNTGDSESPEPLRPDAISAVSLLLATTTVAAHSPSIIAQIHSVYGEYTEISAEKQ